MSRDDRAMITDLFVYGTLKRGECRELMWPRKPIRVRDAFILAQLYDLGAYPAIRVDESDEAASGVEHLDWVAGELWSFAPEDLLATLAVLDEIEQTNQRGYRNLYDHVLIRAFDRPNSRTSRLALVYQFSTWGRLDQSRRLRPRDGEVFVSWSAGPDDR
jgi:gamma-glutamylcyclotransferase (GGCT)/AIG2-like uncharacterized protein YtfP